MPYRSLEPLLKLNVADTECILEGPVNMLTLPQLLDQPNYAFTTMLTFEELVRRKRLCVCEGRTFTPIPVYRFQLFQR